MPPLVPLALLLLAPDGAVARERFMPNWSRPLQAPGGAMTRERFMPNRPRRLQESSGGLAAGYSEGASDAGELSYGWLAEERVQFCAGVANPPPLLDEQEAYPAIPPEQQENYDGRTRLDIVRSEGQLSDLVRACPIAGGDLISFESGDCTSAQTSYLQSLSMYTAPVLLAVFCALVWHTCCWMSFFRCCRRCCLCQERKSPRSIGACQVMCGGLVIFVCTVAIFACAVAVFDRSNVVSDNLTSMLCTVITMADEALNGSGEMPAFLGIDVGIHRMQMIRKYLDTDSAAMTDVRMILDETSPFSAAMDDLMEKLAHMERVLTVVGRHKTKEHTCSFCEMAVGNNATGEIGLIQELRLEIEQSSASAMRAIQATCTNSLTGTALAQVSTAVAQGGTSLEVFRSGFAGALVETIVDRRGDIRTIEDARHTVFQFTAAFCIVHAWIVGGFAVCFVRRSRAKYPNPSPSCTTWFCAFCTLFLSLTYAGVLLLVCVPIFDSCQFWRYELFTHEGFSDYYRQLNLVERNGGMDGLAVDVMRTCFAPNGTGDILGALNLQQKLYFQQELDEHYMELEDKMAGRVVDNAKFELFVSRAQQYGGLFILDPDNLYPLEINAAARMMGSSLDPDDQEMPDGETVSYGLNTYAGLIAGPGQYSFEHGTSGGGTLITATSPSEAEVSDLPVQQQNALIYARLKEQALTEAGLYRCDTLDTQHHVTEISCDYETYVDSVLLWAEEVRDAGLLLGEEAAIAETLIAEDLALSLNGVLVEVRELRTLFDCRFLYKRWEDFDFSLCNKAMPGMLEGAIGWTTLGIFTVGFLVLHYKIWRHLLDNRVVGEELERFAKKYGYLQTRAA